MVKVKCPVCGGKTIKVHETDEYIAFKCVRGHRKTGGWQHKAVKIVHPVVLVEIGKKYQISMNIIEIGSKLRKEA